MYKSRYKLLVIVISLLVFNGCKIINSSSMFKTDNDFEFDAFEPDLKEYVIRPFDKLSVRIFTNNGIQLIDKEKGTPSQQGLKNATLYTVEQDSLVKLPTLGHIKLAGLTIKESEKLLEEQYAHYYQKPFVLVNVTNRRVVVFNSGSNAGNVLNMDNEKFTLIEALAQSGGIDDFSKAYSIKLLRGDLSNPKVLKINISSIEEMKKANLVLQANDIIYVEKRSRYASRTLREITPYITLLNTALLFYVTVTALNK